MAGPSVPWFDAPSRRPVGRLGLVGLLVLAVAVLAAVTSAQASPQAGTATGSDPADPTTRSDPPTYAFGSVTAQGAIVFRLGEPVHAWSVDASGAIRWERDLAAGERLACGPCPAAVLGQTGGRAVTLAADGTTGPPPAAVAAGLLDTRSLIGVVLAAVRDDGRAELLVPTTDGLVSAGVVDGARLDAPLVVVTPATGSAAATILQAPTDPLRQAEFEVVHVANGATTRMMVALDEPSARPLPCAVADAGTVAYLQLRPGPTSAGSTHVVVARDGGPPLDAVVPGSFDACAAGPLGVVLGAVAVGADGDPSHSVVDLLWLDPTLATQATRSERMTGPAPSLAIDPATARVALGGGSGPSVVADGGSRIERAPAAAVAFDDRGGLWAVDRTGRVTHEVAS